MTTKVEKSILVNVPVGTVYNQWTQFEEFPQFMSGIKSITQIDDRTLHWVAEIAGVKREWEATILEQVADEKVAWAATSGATNAGAVYFEAVSTEQTSVRLSLEYEPEGVVEKIGDRLSIVEKQAESDLQKFKEFIESEGYATGAWRGSVNEGIGVGTPGVESAAASEGDSGKSGFSAKAVLATAAVAGVAAAAAAKSKSSDSTDDTTEATVSYETTPVVDTVAPAPVAAPAVVAPVDVDMPLTGDSAAGATYAADVDGIPTSGVAPVVGTPGLSGLTGTPGAANPYAADDDGVTEFGERHGDETTG